MKRLPLLMVLATMLGLGLACGRSEPEVKPITLPDAETPQPLAIPETPPEPEKVVEPVTTTETTAPTTTTTTTTSGAGTSSSGSTSTHSGSVNTYSIRVN